MTSVYINAVGSFLPGETVGNGDMAAFIGPINRKQDILRKAALAKNGILGRHYALDRSGRPLFTNARMAANAGKDALGRSELQVCDVELICAAASQGDLLAPGFASMVHAELGVPTTEIASFTSFCASGVMALKAAVTAIQAGDKANALVCASEFASRFLRSGYLDGAAPAQDTEFLRWTLSDGAGAVVLENRPNQRGQSLKLDFIDLVSYANSFETCMYGGGVRNENGALDLPWSNYPTIDDAKRAGAFHLKQDFRLLENVVPLGLQRYLQLIERGKINPNEIDWILCHFSSQHFREDFSKVARRMGAPIDEAKIFSNLYDKGNTGSASIYVMLEELFNGGALKDGEKVLCMVPESGRFIMSFFQLTVVGETGDQAHLQTAPGDIANAEISSMADDLKSQLVRRLTDVWIGFETNLNHVPIIDKMNRGKLRLEDYRMLLRNLRQQVVEGARWIARAASNIPAETFDLRSSFIGHAQDEHRDFKMLERDYVSAGGKQEEIETGEKNIGSEALSAWMFHKSSRENPVDLLGAMFIIEGLGLRLASKWGHAIKDQLDLSEDQVSFLLYHGDNDETHMDRFWNALDVLPLTPELNDQIVKTAKVTARLYRLQLEELDNL